MKKTDLRHKKRKGPLIICVAVVVIGVLLAMQFWGRKTVVTLSADPVEMKQEEKIPEVPVKVDVEGNEKKVLPGKNEMKVSDLVKQLRSGEGYKIVCDTDGKEEGEFPVKIVLSDQLKKSLDQEWSKKLEIECKNTKVTVKNKYGKWEKSKFKKWDGSYAADEFIVSKGDTYYFDHDGNIVTGERKIGFKQYVFSEKGVMQSEKLLVDPEKPMIALTFDDGPGEGTSRLLDVLEQYNARATFFMVGPQVDQYPEVVKRMHEIGCELGNHTTHHPQLTKLSPEEIMQEIDVTTQSIKKATGGAGPLTVRPPYGAVNDVVKSTVPYPLIMWSVDTQDWKTRNTQSSIDVVLNRASDGDIVLMHDIHAPSIEAAVQLVPELINRGYQLVTVSELAEARGVTLEKGQRYSQIYK